MRGAILALELAAALAGLVSISTAETGGDRIKVDVVDLHSADGDVKCALFNSAEGFPADSSKAIKTTTGRIHDGTAECDFDQVPAGDYGIAVYHDENSNGKLDRNFLGIPREGVGASNDAAGTLGPPPFDRARFTYSGGAKALTIHIRYL